ncbi:cytochrome C [Chryseobacterium sp. RR2-3-20]|uniref:c-type cytochrome n=1 Tax=Chryseobacterium sp. RR2-3-20 TaxID=2787626 RepID=UPI001AE08836|nr:cytochrome C [Chryseobacterium sp. RR2-3-20]
MKNILLTGLAIGLLSVSCTPKSNAATEAQKVSTNTAEQIAQGKTIFENACKRCHELPEPTKFTSVEWVGIMNSMAPKAKLSDEQHQWVYDYVVSVKK